MDFPVDVKYVLKKIDIHVIKRRADNKKRRHKDPRKEMINSAKSRAKDINIDFNITYSDLILPELCPVFGIPLKVADGVMNDNSPSLDRTNSNLGYTKDNIGIMSYRANYIKNNGTIENRIAIIKYMRDALNVIEYDELDLEINKILTKLNITGY